MATPQTPNFIQVPCGRCIGCKLDKGQHWGIRMMHEAQMHDENAFITLTFDDEHLPPPPYSLTRGKNSHMTLFLKRLRNKIGPFKYYYCGEYGEPTKENNLIARPHYHLCIFGWEPDDAVHFTNNERGDPLFESKFLDEKWENGHTTTGELTYDSACYTARYTLKKISGTDPKYKDHYKSVDTETGEILTKIPEYSNQSNRPGIGASWLQKYHSDVYPTGEVVHNGFRTKPPTYYDSIQEKLNPVDFKDMKTRRIQKALQSPDRDHFRLKAREKVKQAQISHLPQRS